MSLGKKDIIKNISTKAHISLSLSDEILESFLCLLKTQTLNNTLKLPNFGTLYRKSSAERIGRNPISKEEFVIPSRSKLTFKSSNKVKSILN